MSERGGLTRRALIQRGVLGGILLACGGTTWLALRPTVRRPLPEIPLKLLTHAQYSVLLAVVERCVPDPISTEAERQSTVLRVDQTLALADRRTRTDFTQLLGLLDNALVGFILGGVSQPFTALRGTEQDDVLESWRKSRIAVRRTGYQALRRLVATHFYADPAAQAAIGYPGPPKGLQ